MSVSTPASSAAAPVPAQDKPSLETRHPGLLMLAVIGVSIIQLLDLTIANVALPHMQAGLGASLDTVSWVLTSYIIAGVMMTPAVGWVSDRFGSRKVFLWAVAGFLLASMLCGAATSLGQMVLFRGLQGICAAFVGPMSQTILLDTTAPSKQARVMSLWGMTVMIAPISGPMLGGLLTDALNWRWVFYINLPIGIPTLLLLVWLLPTRDITTRRLDKFGFVLIAIALGALQLVLDRGQHLDWLSSWEIILELLVAVTCFWMFMVHSNFTDKPLFTPSLFKNPAFVATFGFMFMLGVANVGLVSILPTMFQTLYGYSPFDTGLLMAPRGVGVFLTMTLAGYLMSRMDVRYMVFVGFCIAGLALWYMAGFTIQLGTWPIIVGGFFQGLGLGFVFMPMNMVAFSSIAPEHRPDASSLMNLMRNLGGSFGISWIITMLSRNQQTSHSDLATHIRPEALMGFDAQSLSARLGESSTAVLQMVDAEINRQALMIAYLDNFYMMAILVLLMAPVMLLMKPMRMQGSAAK